MNEPTLRQATWRERLVYRVTGHWPQSYVDARLAYCDALAKHFELTTPQRATLAFLTQDA